MCAVDGFPEPVNVEFWCIVGGCDDGQRYVLLILFIESTADTTSAFGAQYRFQERVIAVTDTFQQMDHFYWSLQAWLMYRFDVLSASSTLILTLVAIYTGVSPGLTAFVLVAASKCMCNVIYVNNPNLNFQI